jgi:hypothetical protein
MKTENRHKCEASEPEHFEVCIFSLERCTEDEEGKLFIDIYDDPDNEEHSLRVNYCPFCGYRAPSQIVK